MALTRNIKPSNIPHTSRLHRYEQEGDDHFITFSCHHRLPYLNTPASKTTFLNSLEATRKNYHLQVLGYVLMLEHVHLLLSEPDEKRLSTAIQALNSPSPSSPHTGEDSAN